MPVSETAKIFHSHCQRFSSKKKNIPSENLDFVAPGALKFKKKTCFSIFRTMKQCLIFKTEGEKKRSAQRGKKIQRAGADR